MANAIGLHVLRPDRRLRHRRSTRTPTASTLHDVRRPRRSPSRSTPTTTPRWSATWARRTSTHRQTARLMLTPGGSSSPTASSTPRTAASTFEAKHLVFLGRSAGRVPLRGAGLVGQADPPDRRLLPRAPSSATATIDYRNYRTTDHARGHQDGSATRQETDTISRLVYGFASAYLMTGEDASWKPPRRAPSTCATTCASSTPTRTSSTGTTPSTSRRTHERKIFTSEFGDDYDAIPAYEQIYALAGPTQTYRITGDPRDPAATST